MKLYNTLTRKIEDFKPLKDNKVRIYSCGPTVYDHIHIGNLSSFIYFDTLRRVLKTEGYDVKHVMNFTDVDDKTINRSAEQYPDLAPEEALKKLTGHYSKLFLDDMKAIGNDVPAVDFVTATEQIEQMQTLIKRLHKDGFAYIADDGVYFSIAAYKKSGKKYGQLLELKASNTSEERINNDEYDKESVHDFALWKLQKGNEPAWEFELDGHNLLGRPGWHIECSAMSVAALGQPFDIHTGGVDLIFPHHENEIAQSTAGQSSQYAACFVHNEHLLVDGRKMSKSLNNFYTLEDVKERGFDPMALRLLVLQSHYRSQSNFTWENLEAAQNRLKSFYAWADIQFQSLKSDKLKKNYGESLEALKNDLSDDLKTPAALAFLNGMVQRVAELGADSGAIAHATQELDHLLGLGLSSRQDVNSVQAQLLESREEARKAKDWQKSDQLRKQIEEQGIGINDTNDSSIWYRL